MKKYKIDALCRLSFAAPSMKVAPGIKKPEVHTGIKGLTGDALLADLEQQRKQNTLALSSSTMSVPGKIRATLPTADEMRALTPEEVSAFLTENADLLRFPGQITSGLIPRETKDLKKQVRNAITGEMSNKRYYTVNYTANDIAGNNLANDDSEIIAPSGQGSNEDFLKIVPGTPCILTVTWKADEKYNDVTGFWRHSLSI